MNRRGALGALLGGAVAGPEIVRNAGRAIGGGLPGPTTAPGWAGGASATLADTPGDKINWMQDRYRSLSKEIADWDAGNIPAWVTRDAERYNNPSMIEPSVDCLVSVRDTSKLRMQKQLNVQRQLRERRAEMQRDLENLLSNMGPAGRLALGITNYLNEGE